LIDLLTDGSRPSVGEARDLMIEDSPTNDGVIKGNQIAPR
jgi:hypothetical protein